MFGDSIAIIIILGLFAGILGLSIPATLFSVATEARTTWRIASVYTVLFVITGVISIICYNYIKTLPTDQDLYAKWSRNNLAVAEASKTLADRLKNNLCSVCGNKASNVVHMVASDRAANENAISTIDARAIKSPIAFACEKHVEYIELVKDKGIFSSDAEKYLELNYQGPGAAAIGVASAYQTEQVPAESRGKSFMRIFSIILMIALLGLAVSFSICATVAWKRVLTKRLRF